VSPCDSARPLRICKIPALIKKESIQNLRGRCHKTRAISINIMNNINYIGKFQALLNIKIAKYYLTDDE
jgi:hypothetical protein